jgi:hypothetical protein
LSEFLNVNRPLSSKKGSDGGAMTLSITTFSITSLSIKGLHETLSIINTQHNNAECRVLFVTKLNIFMLCVVMLNVVMLSVASPAKVLIVPAISSLS